MTLLQYCNQEVESREIKVFGCNDCSNGSRLAYHFGHIIKYAKDKRAWYVWDGKCWKRDIGRIYIVRMAVVVIRLIKEEVDLIDDTEWKKRHLKWANTSGSYNKINSMIRMARIIKGISFTRGKNS